MPSKRDGDINSSEIICKGDEPTNIHSLPDELLSDILVRLPADQIHDVARLVCPRWYHIVHSSDFIKTQVRNSTCGLILSRNRSGAGYHPVLLTAKKGAQVKRFEFECRLRLYGSCNGLVVDYDYKTKSFHILNLVTKKDLALPSCSRNGLWLSECGIGYAAASMEYKVVVPVLEDVGDSSYLLSLAILTVGVDESWRNVPVKKLPQQGSFRGSMFPLCTEGSIHWLLNGRRQVLTLDVETENFTTSTIPRLTKFDACSYFLSTGRFLTLLVPRGGPLWEIWGMGPQDREWTKVLPDINLGRRWWRFASRNGRLFASRNGRLLIPLWWVKYPEVLAFRYMATGGTCVFFNLETREIDSIELPVPLPDFSCYVHKNTMAWCV